MGKENEPSELDHKSFNIIIDGTPYSVEGDEVTFDDIVNRAYPDGGRGPLITYTVTYYNGGGRIPEGTMGEDDKVKVKDGTVFNVTRTDRS